MRADAPSRRASPTVLGGALLVLAAVLTYGYEIVGFHLTLDEPVSGRQGRGTVLSTWLGQGRWAMGLVNALLPGPVTPVVTTLLGVLGLTVGLFALARRHGGGPLVAAAAAAVGLSLPQPSLQLTFATTALGIGLGFALLPVLSRTLVSVAPVPRVVLSAGLVALLFGIYESLALAAAVVVLLRVWDHPRGRTVGEGALILVAGVAGSLLVARALQRALGVAADGYVASALDPAAGLADRLGALGAAVTTTASRVGATGRVFEQAHPVLPVLGLVALTLAGWSVLLLGGPVRDRLWRGGVLAGVVAVPVLAQLLVRDLPFRAMLYLPVIVVALAVCALPAWRRWRDRAWVRWATVVLVALVVAGNASLATSAQAAAEPALAHDRYLALRIDEELRLAGVDPAHPLPVVLRPRASWPGSSVNPPVEHLGGSLLSGERWRYGAFLTSQGVPVRIATADEERRAAGLLDGMPPWPQPGWVQVRDGLALVNVSR